MCAHLFRNLLPHCGERGRRVDIFLVAHLQDVDQDPRLPMDEALKDVFLECWQVIGDLMATADTQGVVAVREEDGLQLAVVVQEVAGMDVRQLHLMLLPSTAKQEPGIQIGQSSP